MSRRARSAETRIERPLPIQVGHSLLPVPPMADAAGKVQPANGRTNQMRNLVLAVTLVTVAAPAQASESLFAQLVDATSNSDQNALVRLLSTETLSTSTGSVDQDNRLSGGTMRHGVPAAEIAGKLQGCSVKQWRDSGSERGRPYILWLCPTKRVRENDCYFYSYRAEMLDGRYHPPNLLVHEMPSRDPRCGPILPPPSRP
jgi:hypothetical protein